MTSTAKLRDNFYVAQAQTESFQTLSAYVAFVTQISSNDSVREALAHVPEKVLRGRNFLQIAMDDAMDAYAEIMARILQRSDVELKDLPTSFFMKLLNTRHGKAVPAPDAMNLLKRYVDHKSALLGNGPKQQPTVPTSMRLIANNVDTQTFSNLVAVWSSLLHSFSTLMMEAPALAAVNASKELFQESMAFLNQLKETAQIGAGNAAGGVRDLSKLTEELKQKNLPKDVRTKVDEELADVRQNPNGMESNRKREYLKWVAALPWNQFDSLETDFKKTEKILNDDHYGLDKVKRAITEHVAVENRAKNPTGRILCLIGPPGVGKTSIGASIARATGRKFARMSLGGVRDEAVIRGHGRTYIGSRPGRIIETMKALGANNGLILLDEIDKMGHISAHGDPSAAMLEVLDPAQNNTFRDHYMEVDYDLSKIMFIATANDIGSIPDALRDRMDIINIPGYTREEKLQIAKRHLVPKKMKANSLTGNDIEFTDAALGAIISKHTREAGVRTLEKSIDAICRKIVVAQAEGRTAKTVIDAADLEELLGPSRIKRQDVKKNGDRIGHVNGLAWSAVGGSIMQIEVVVRPARGTSHQDQDFRLHFTGNLGKVMDESAQAALSASLQSIIDQCGNLPDTHGNVIHVNTVEGSVPKDGPSAGAAIATAIISAITKTPIRCNVAMTGAISGNGDVLPIGGLPEKLDGALQDGADTVLIPQDNVADLHEVPKSIRDKLTIIPVSRLEEVLQHALASPVLCALNQLYTTGGRLPANDTGARKELPAIVTSRPPAPGGMG